MNKELIVILQSIGQMEKNEDGSGCFAVRMINEWAEWCNEVSCDNCPLNLNRLEIQYYHRLILTIPIGST